MSTRQVSQKWDRVYQEGGDIWTFTDAPTFLRREVHPLAKRKKVLSIGCGVGEYETSFAAGDGPRVLGIDLSEHAISVAKKHTWPGGARFKQGNFLNMELPGNFDLVYDWTAFHHINPRLHRAYEQKLWEILKDGGKYVMCCASDSDRWFADGQEVVTGDSGFPLYRNTPEHIVTLFSPEFRLERFETARFGDMFPHWKKHELRKKGREALDRKFDQYLFRRT